MKKINDCKRIIIALVGRSMITDIIIPIIPVTIPITTDLTVISKNVREISLAIVAGNTINEEISTMPIIFMATTIATDIATDKM